MSRLYFPSLTCPVLLSHEALFALGSFEGLFLVLLLNLKLATRSGIPILGKKPGELCALTILKHATLSLFERLAFLPLEVLAMCQSSRLRRLSGQKCGPYARLLLGR